MEARSSKNRMPSDSVSSEKDPLPVHKYLPSCFILTSHMMERERAFFLSFSSYKGINPMMGISLSWPHLNLITSKGPTSKYYHFRDKSFKTIIWGYWIIQLIGSGPKGLEVRKASNNAKTFNAVIVVTKKYFVSDPAYIHASVAVLLFILKVLLNFLVMIKYQSVNST